MERPSSIWTMMSLVKRETVIVLERTLTTLPTTKHPGQNKASQIVDQIFKELTLETYQVRVKGPRQNDNHDVKLLGQKMVVD